MKPCSTHYVLRSSLYKNTTINIIAIIIVIVIITVIIIIVDNNSNQI